jgi:hypothetical protein
MAVTGLVGIAQRRFRKTAPIKENDMTESLRLGGLTTARLSLLVKL